MAGQNNFSNPVNSSRNNLSRINSSRISSSRINSSRNNSLKENIINNILFKNQNSANLLSLIKKDNDIKDLSDEGITKFVQEYRYISRNNNDDFLGKVENLLEWYKTKNEDFSILSSINDGNGPHMPEFHTLLVTITLNIIKVLSTQKFPGRRTEHTNIKTPRALSHRKSHALYDKKINSDSDNDNDIAWKELLNGLLAKIAELNTTDSDRPDYYSYLNIMDIYLQYIIYMSGIKIKVSKIKEKLKNSSYDLINSRYINNINTNDITLCENYILYLYYIFNNTPFILYPTFVQLAEKKVLKTLSAPVVNFYLSYTRTNSHNYFIPPCYHVEHDVIFHGTLTHFHLLNTFPSHAPAFERQLLVNYKKLVITKMDDNIKSRLKAIYENLLNPFFNYTILNGSPEIINILFNLFHEHMDCTKTIFDDIYTDFDKHIPIINIINQFMNNIYNSKSKEKEILDKKLKKEPYLKEYFGKSPEKYYDEYLSEKSILLEFLKKAAIERFKVEFNVSFKRPHTSNSNNSNRNNHTKKLISHESKGRSNPNNWRSFSNRQSTRRQTRNRYAHESSSNYNSNWHSPNRQNRQSNRTSYSSKSRPVNARTTLTRSRPVNARTTLTRSRPVNARPSISG
jgi:hypothetical protein